MAQERRYRIDPDRAEWRRAGNRIVVGTRQGGRMFELLGAAEQIWQRLVPGATITEIVTALTDEFDVDEAVAAADTARFVDALEAQGLLAPAD